VKMFKMLCATEVVGVWLLFCATVNAASTVMDVNDTSTQAMAILRSLENTRMSASSFRLKGVISRFIPNGSLESKFTIEYQDGQYRVLTSSPQNAIVIFDGEKLLSYDGNDSAVINSAGTRVTTSIACDPRSIGFSTGFYSDLTLEENIAYHSGNNLSLIAKGNPGDSGQLVVVKLTDRFSQEITFVAEPRMPFRVHKYVKGIPDEEDGSILYRYVTESEFWPDNQDEWLPQKIKMYTLYGNDSVKKIDEITVAFDRPDRNVHFDGDSWTVKGLGLPFGQAVADLRIKERIGYWDGLKLTPNVPVKGMQPIAQPGRTKPFRVVFWINIAVMGAVLFVLVFRWTVLRGSHRPG